MAYYCLIMYIKLGNFNMNDRVSMIGKIFLYLLLSSFIWARGVPAGTSIVNVAQLTYLSSTGVEYNVTSNRVVDVVDQVIELDIACQLSKNVLVQKGEKKRALTFNLTNTGNGTDHFSLIPDTNESSVGVINRYIYLDDGDGVFNAANDIQINDINLTADANVTLFFVSDIPSVFISSPTVSSWTTSSNGIEARSTIGGSGISGTGYTLSDYFAVDGYKGGVDRDYCTYELTQLSLKLIKSATLSSPKLFTGSTIHYKIETKILGMGTLNDVTIEDRIPVGTKYLNGTLTLDGILLNDAVNISGGVISINVGDMVRNSSSETKHILTFDVLVE